MASAMVSDSRIAESASYLEKQGFDAMLAACNGQNLFLDSNVVFVFSGVRPIGESAVIIERSGRSTLVVTPAWDAERAAALSRTDDTLGCDDLAEGIERALKKIKVNPARVVTVALSTLFAQTVKNIKKVLGGKRPANDGFASQ